MAHGRYDLTEFEWNVIKPLLPNKARGVPRVDDRRVLNRIFYQLRSGSPWADLPERYGPYKTVHNRFNRWRKAGVWNRLMDAIIVAYEAKGQKLQMIDSTSVRVHQQAAAQKNRMEFVVSVVRGEDTKRPCQAHTIMSAQRGGTEIIWMFRACLLMTQRRHHQRRHVHVFGRDLAVA